MARRTRVYLDVPLAVGQITSITGPSAHHLLHVLRARIDDPVTLFNGDGQLHDARITATDRHRVDTLIIRSTAIDNESPLELTLGQCLSRGDHMDFAIQKAVELGVRHIVPVISEHAVRPPSKLAQLDKKLAHWQSIMISACEQSGRTRIPSLCSPMDMQAFLELQQSAGSATLVFAPEASRKLAELDQPVGNRLSLLIGPEGGISARELDLAMDRNAIPVSLGQRVLRTETAAITAIALAQGLWGDL